MNVAYWSLRWAVARPLRGLRQMGAESGPNAWLQTARRALYLLIALHSCNPVDYMPLIYLQSAEWSLCSWCHIDRSHLPRTKFLLKGKKESKHGLRLNINGKVVLHQSVWYQCKSGTWKCDVMQVWFISRWLPRWSCLLGCCQWPGSMNASSIRCLYEILTQGGALVLWKNNPTRRWGLCMDAKGSSLFGEKNWLPDVARKEKK